MDPELLTEFLTYCSEIRDELRKIRCALEGRKKTASGGFLPEAPHVELVRQEDGRFRGRVPEDAKLKECQDGCGTAIFWATTQYGKRTIEASGFQHRCPNYNPSDPRRSKRRSAPPPPPPEDSPEVPF